MTAISRGSNEAIPPECGPKKHSIPEGSQPGWHPAGMRSITLAWRHRDSCLLILDEKRGRKVATNFGLKITGTAGLLTDAAAAGLIDFDDAFIRLAQSGFRLSPQVVESLRRSLIHRKA